jgi:NAD(P)-dependent dehydrogenase (short-subunit alcohol dehydrogenase family)
MAASAVNINMAERNAYIITGPTSGFGLATAHQVAKHGTVILVGRDLGKLKALQRDLRQNGGDSEIIVCDLSDIDAVKQAAAEITRLRLPLAGLVNNVGIRQVQPTRNAQGWDMSYATNHLGPFVLTEALIPYLPDGGNIVFIVSAVEDPERQPAKTAGFRGGRYISAEASARGEWMPGGAKVPGFDSYATTKQCELAAALELARETPRLRINAIEPGFAPATNLGRETKPLQHFLIKHVLGRLAPHMKNGSTPERTAPVITKILLNKEGTTGIYYNEKGHSMQPSALMRDPEFRLRVINETRAFLAK